MKKWKIGIISAGGFARGAHFPNCKAMEQVEIAACCDMNEKLLNETCDAFGVKGRHTSVDAMLSAERLDVAIVVVRPTSHIPLAKKCVEAGCNVLVEKPLSENYAEILSFQEFLAGRREKVMVSQNYRFQNHALAMRDIIQNDMLGRAYWLEITKHISAGPAPADNPWYKSPFINIGVHDIDCARFFAGDEIEAVEAIPVRPPFAPNIKYSFADMRIFFRGGLTALVRMDWTSQGMERWTTHRAQGSKGVALCDPLSWPDAIIQCKGRPTWRYRIEEEDNAMRRVLAHLFESIEQDRQPDTCVGDNIKTMEAALAAYLSCRERRAIVFPEDRELLRSV